MSSRRVLDIRKPKKAPAAQSRANARASMTPLFPQKATRLRMRRRKLRIIALCVGLLSAAGLVGAAGFASHAERLTVSEIRVSGARTLAPENLIAAVNAGLDTNFFRIFSGRNIFLYPAAAIEERLTAEFPRIKEVDLSREGLLAQAVVVTVKERQPFAKWCSGDIRSDSHVTDGEACYAMDASGFLYAEAGSEPYATSYVFREGLLPGEAPIGQYFLQGRFAAALHFLETLRAAGYETEEMRVENEKDFSVVLKKGFTLLVPFDTEPETLARNLKLALEAEAVRGRESVLQRIDLRFGNRVYYTFREE